MNNVSTVSMTDEDWIDRGKADAWEENPNKPQNTILKQQVCMTWVTAKEKSPNLH